MNANHVRMLVHIVLVVAPQLCAHYAQMDTLILLVAFALQVSISQITHLLLAALVQQLIIFVFNVLMQLTALFAKQDIPEIYVIHALLVIKILTVVPVF